MSLSHDVYALYGVRIAATEGDFYDALATMQSARHPYLAGEPVAQFVVDGGTKPDETFLSIRSVDVGPCTSLSVDALATGAHWADVLRNICAHLDLEQASEPGWFLVHDWS
ncbi:hypothetical protein [Streptomyces venezuelae]|uniref:hypothetical protein n=1 Tax=Streptomyces venezuelae TaxID=54571 RepID=UPI00343C7286